MIVNYKKKKKIYIFVANRCYFYGIFEISPGTGSILPLTNELKNLGEYALFEKIIT